jgi:hypothetical protein
MNEAEIRQASERFRQRFADKDGRVPPASVILPRAERQFLQLLKQHGAYDPLAPFFEEKPADEGLSFEQAVQIVGGFAQYDEQAFMRLGYLMAVLMRDAKAVATAAEYLELPAELRTADFYHGPAFGKV